MSDGQTDPRRRQPAGEGAPRGRGRAPRVQEDASNVTVIDTDVFVKRLPADADETVIRNTFSTFGNITNIRLTRRQGRQFASITFETAAAASKCLAGAANVRVNGQEVEIEQRRTVTRPPKAEGAAAPAGEARPPRQPRAPKQQAAAAAPAAAPAAPVEADPNSVWIGGIDRDVTADDVRAFASKYGPVARLTIRSRFAIVAFETAKAAADAVAGANGAKIGERVLEVAQAKPPQPRAARKPRAPRAEGGAAAGGAAPAAGGEAAPRRRQRTRTANPAQVFVGGVTEESEDDIKKHFSNIVKIERRRGFARVTFETPEAAQAALAKNGQELFAGKGPSRVELSR
eukprot:m.154073 g.154073  ORF g.154073 m.154073 type:complete len:344 (+) comp16951_c0_seq14:78-1109(+)